MLPTYKISEQSNGLREEMGIGDQDRVPDIIECIRQAGFEYQEDRFGHDFSAFSKYLGAGKYRIGFNLNHHWSSKFFRFTIAHELGHVTLPHHRKILEQTDLHRSKSEYRSSDDIEREADSFSINFLAPKEQFLKAATARNFSTETIIALSEDFQISTYATALRFIELTDLSCTLLVCNSNGTVEYEKRSDRMKESYFQRFLSGKRISKDTVTGEFLGNKENGTKGRVSLSEWYNDLNQEIEADESVIELGYNGKYLTLLTPDVANLNELEE